MRIEEPSVNAVEGLLNPLNLYPRDLNTSGLVALDLKKQEWYTGWNRISISKRDVSRSDGPWFWLYGQSCL